MPFPRPLGTGMAAFKRHLVSAEDRRRRAATLGDLARQGLDVFCWCNRCTHHATVATAELILRLGPATPVPEVGAGMRCSGCGARDVATRPAWPSLGQVARHG